jgi:PAS domain S-box-containing protein
MKSILIVDDELVQAKNVEALVISQGFVSLGVATNGNEALERARATAPDLVLLDIVMPGELDGIEAGRVIQTELSIPVVFMTAQTSDAPMDRVTAVHPYGVLIKPFSGGVLKATIEIALRRRAEEALRDQEQRFRTIIEHGEAGYVFFNPQGVILEANSPWLRMHGYDSPSEVVGKNLSVTFFEQDRPELAATLARLRAGDALPPGEYQRRRKDGSAGSNVFHAHPVRRAEQLVGVDGFLIDTTEQRRAQSDYQMLFNEMLDGFALHELVRNEQGEPCDYRFLAVNPAFESHTGIKARDSVGRTVRETLPNLEDFWIEQYARVVTTGAPTQFERFSPELDRYYRVSAFKAGHDRFACIFEDVTRRRLAERQGQIIGEISRLFLTTPLLDELYKELPRILAERFGADYAALALYDEDRREMVLLGAYGLPALLGNRMPVESIVAGQVAETGESCFLLAPFPPSDQRSDFIQCMGIQTYLYTPMRAQEQALGALILANARSRPGLKLAQAPLQIIADHLALHIRQAQTQTALEASEKRLNFVMDAGRIGYWDWDMLEDAFIFSSTCAENLGFSLEEISVGGCFWKERLHPDDKPRVLEVLEQHLSGLAPYFVSEHRLLTKTGQWKWILCQGKSLTRNALGEPTRMVGVMIDIDSRKRAEKALAESCALTESLVQNMPFDLWSRNTDGIITFQSKHSMAYWGDKRGTSIDQLGLSPEQKTLWKEHLAAVLAGGVVDAEVSSVRNGETRHFQRIIAPIRIEGKVTGALGINLDTTERKRLQARKDREAELHAAMARMAERLLGCSAVEEAATVTLEKALRLTHSPHGYVGYIDPDSGALHIPAFNNAKSSCLLGAEVPVFNNFNGIWGWAIKNKRPVLTNDPQSDPRWSGTPEGHLAIERFLTAPAVHGDQVLGVIAVSNAPREYDEDDLTIIERLASVFALGVRRIQAEAQRSAALEAAQAANRAKSEFLATMSHELRTPLNGVMGMLQLLQATPLDQEQTEFADAAMDSSRSLLRLLSDLLDLSRIEAGKLTLVEERFDVSALLQTAVTPFVEQAQNKSLRLCTTIPPETPVSLLGDPIRLRQILFNLVGNAVKFTETGSVEVNASVKQNGDDTNVLILVVRDTGVGIPEDKLATVLEAFAQADGSYKRKYQGAGLGLGIVQRLVKLMRGEISVESELGKGTTIVCRIPVRIPKSNHEPKPRPRASNTGMPSCRLLLVEDDAISCFAAKRMLEQLGHQVACATNGGEAVEYCLQQDFDCILMDIQMPGMSGLEATGAIRNLHDRAKAATPIVALTAYAMKGDKERFLAAGMNDFLAKPIHAQELGTILEKMLAPSDSNE